MHQALTRPWQVKITNGPVWRGWRADGSGPTLHFLSGNGFCGATYWPFLRRFLPEFGLFANDIEGFGSSDAPARYPGLRTLLHRIDTVVQESGLERGNVIGMGHSFGGALTLRYAAAHPGRFRALVLLDPVVIPNPAWLLARCANLVRPSPLAKKTLRRRARWPSRQEALQRLRGRGVYAGWTEEALESFIDHAMMEQEGEWVLRCPPALEAQIYERPIYAWSAFRKIDCPVLFLYGRDSYTYFPQASRRARALNPRVEIEVLPGGHCFMQEDPPAAHAVVAGFLRSCL